MAPGTWSAAGDECAPALASEAAYCSRSRTALPRCRGTGASMPSHGSEQRA